MKTEPNVLKTHLGETRKIWLKIETVQDSYSPRYAHIRVILVERDHEVYTRVAYSDTEHWEIYSQCDDRGKFYAIEQQINNFRGNVSETKRACRFLERIDRGLKRLSEKLGHHSGLTSYVLRVATVLGINRFIRFSERNQEWSEIDIPTAQYYLDDEQQKLIAWCQHRDADVA